MSKLWIVHRNPQLRASFARLCGLADTDLFSGAPGDHDFIEATAPAALILGLEGDFELELEFAHRQRARLAKSRWLLICRPTDVAEARRLFESTNPEILEIPPAPRRLRAFIAAALAHRTATSLAERQQRQRIAERFSSWLGGVEIPGLLRALDPSLANLPLLVRGGRGSGRSLVCHYVDLFRGESRTALRVHGSDLREPGELIRRLRETRDSGGEAIRSIWIDEVDALSISAQNTLAEWIAHGWSPPEIALAELRWIATAGPSGLPDRLEPRLEHAFAPLRVEVPALMDHPNTLAAFTEEVARDWANSVGGIPRSFADSALSTLEAHPWFGDRAELEAVVRMTLAATGRAVIEDVDLRFPTDESEPELNGPFELESNDTVYALTSLPEVEAEDETTAGEGHALESAVFEDLAPEESTRLSEASLDLTRAQTLPPAIPTPAPPPAPTRTPAQTTPETSARGSYQGWRRLARSLSHEIRNPLVSIRTFAELLPEHFDDETFRARFTELVGKDVAHIGDVLTRLSSVAERDKPEAEAVDVSALIEALLEERRERIAQSRLLVLRELERDAPLAWTDARGLQVAMAGLLDRALASLPERGDLFVATRRLDRGPDGQPRLRILLRHHNPAGGSRGDERLAEFDPTSNVLEYVLAETVVEASGGSLTIDATDAHETLILIDLRTPS